MACADRCGDCVYYRQINGCEGECHGNPPQMFIRDNGDPIEWRPRVDEDEIACRHFQYRTGSEDE